MKRAIKREEINRLMFINGLMVKDLAAKVGISSTYMSSVMNANVPISPKLAKKMANALNVSIEDLFEVEIKTKEETR